MEKKQLTKIGAWSKSTSKGDVITFSINGKKYSMWKNIYKKEPKHPDYNIIEDKPYDKAEKSQNNSDDLELPF